MELPMLWLVAAILAHSALAMSLYLIRLQEPNRRNALKEGFLESNSGNKIKRSVGFGGFENIDTSSWFTWSNQPGRHQVSASDFSPPDFANYGGGHGHGGDSKRCHEKSLSDGRDEASLGPLFTTNVKEVPEETRNSFNMPAETTPEARRSKYGLNRNFFTPPHAYRVAEEVPFFETLDHKTVFLTLENFRAENNIPLHFLQSIRPFFPFFVKN